MTKKVNFDRYATNAYNDAVYWAVDQSEGYVPPQIQAYKERMAEFKENYAKKIRKENTEDLQDRLAKLDIDKIDLKNKLQILNLIDAASIIRSFAKNNDYEINDIDFRTMDNAVKAAKARLECLQKGQDETDFASNIDAKAYTQKHSPRTDFKMIM